jgi:hypothetical protein
MSLINQQSLQAAADTSRNWSGYAAQNGQFTKVSGSWKVPSISASDPSAADAAWIGIGGVTSNDLIQSGTQDMINPDGSVSTSGFYELLPDGPVTIPTVTVNPGDSVTVSIVQKQPNQWLISFADTTDHQTYSTTVAYNSSLSSAEWIEEAPSNGYSTVPLANFGKVSFTGGATNLGTISQSGGQPLSMVDDYQQTLATPSTLGSDGASFTVTDQQTTTTQLPQPGSGTGSGDPYNPYPYNPDPTNPWWWGNPGGDPGWWFGF